jgi:hypothetical protein
VTYGFGLTFHEQGSNSINQPILGELRHNPRHSSSAGGSRLTFRLSAASGVGPRSRQAGPTSGDEPPWREPIREGTTGVAARPRFTFWNISSRSGRMNENRKSPCIRPMGIPTSRPSAFRTSPPETPRWRSVKQVTSLLGVRWPTYPVDTTMPFE